MRENRLPEQLTKLIVSFSKEKHPAGCWVFLISLESVFSRTYLSVGRQSNG